MKAVKGKNNSPFQPNKHRKVVGQAYPINRFGVGDLLEGPSGVQGVVTGRDGVKRVSTIMWPTHSSNVTWGDDLLYFYKGEKK